MSVINKFGKGIRTLRPWFNTNSSNKLDFTLKNAKGVYLYDNNNNKIIDFTSGLMVTNLGHNNKYINNKMIETINNGLLYFPPSVLTDEREKLSSRLIDKCNIKNGKVFYTNGGADANEAAIYFIKQHFKDISQKSRILRFENSFHGGSTYLSSYLGGDNRRNDKTLHFKIPFNNDAIMPNPINNGMESLNKIESIFKKDHQNIAAILLEGSSGTAGCYVYPKDYYKKLETLAKKFNILVIVDEVMSGFGRTGKLFGYQNYDGNPDIITMAKGLTNGCVPMGAVILSEELSNNFKLDPVNTGLTYSGHQLACATANSCLDLYTDELFQQVKNNEKTLETYFRYFKLSYPHLIKDYRGIGQLYCIEFYDNYIININKKINENNIYTFFRDNNLFIAPPLIITNKELIKTLEKLDYIFSFHNNLNE